MADEKLKIDEAAEDPNPEKGRPAGAQRIPQFGFLHRLTTPASRGRIDSRLGTPLGCSRLHAFPGLMPKRLRDLIRSGPAVPVVFR